jgi:hypothetical protein
MRPLLNQRCFSVLICCFLSLFEDSCGGDLRSLVSWVGCGSTAVLFPLVGVTCDTKKFGSKSDVPDRDG